METEKNPIKTPPDAMSQEVVLKWGKWGRLRRLEEKIEYEREHPDRLGEKKGNIFD